MFADFSQVSDISPLWPLVYTTGSNWPDWGLYVLLNTFLRMCLDTLKEDFNNYHMMPPNDYYIEKVKLMEKKQINHTL